MTKKYRPYFSPEELTEIIQSLKSNSGNLSLIKYLETFALKIDHGILEPNLTLQPTISDKLELNTVSPKDYLKAKRLDAYNKWTNTPAKCTPHEIALSRMYRYENDLMCSEEEAEYEKHFETGY